MALESGSRLGQYEITALIGVGGMGEVYRATDTKLGRQVAIKTLPVELASDKDRLARFEREAKLLAALHHPHIAAVYGLDEHEGTQYLAMELVEGETLEAKLKRGAPPADEALRLGLQIAEALEAAHAKGVVHRDLKPANVMVTRDGVVKVLDFGLAKAFATDPKQTVVGHSPALSLAMTQQGFILGTAGYMSPEQASGQPSDQRADVWAFGVVLYEMLTGSPLFSGESVPHVLADVLRTEPNWDRLPKNLHPRVKALLDRCLEKKVRNRYHSIADVRIEIEKILSDPQGAAVLPTARPISRWSPVPLLATLIVVTGVVTAILTWNLKPAAPNPIGLQRVSVMTPENRPVVVTGFPTRSLTLSPDGTRLVYAGGSADPTARHLELRALASLAVQDLPGTEGAFQPFFSPDGQWVGFFTITGELKKVSLAGGNAITLAEKINGSEWAFGVWTEEDTIVFSKGTPTGLSRVSAQGGEVTDLTTLDAGHGELVHSFPALVPASRAVLFTVNYQQGTSQIDAVMLDSGKRRMVLKDARLPLLLSGGRFLLFQREQSILIAPFDPKRLTAIGTAVPLTDDVRRDALNQISVAQLAVSQNGTLAYLPAAEPAWELGLVSRDGSFEKLGLPPGDYSLPRVSPDGSAVAFLEARGQKSTARIYDLRRGTTTTLGMGENDAGLAWHPNGRSVAVSSAFGKGAGGIVLENLDGTRQQLLANPNGEAFLRAGSWSPVGNHFSYVVQNGSRHGIWVVTMGEKPGDKPVAAPFIDSAEVQINPQFSPDGRWVAFASNQSGRIEVYVQQYPMGERLPVSTDGGIAPVWRRDGKELYFQGGVAGVPKLMAVSVTPEGDALRLGKPVPLFDLRTPGPVGTAEVYAIAGNLGAAYDVLPDGKRLVMVRGADPEGTRQIVLVQNWFEELKRPVPTK